MSALAPSRVVRSAAALMANTVLTAALGVVFWVLAARLVPAARLGVDSALISAMVLLASMAELNLAAALPRLLPQVPGHRRGGAVAISYAATCAVAAALAIGFVVVAPAVSASFSALRDVGLALAFCVSVCAWNVFSLEDAVLVAIRRSSVVPINNAAFGALKVVLMVALVAAGVQRGVFFSWVVAMVLVAALVNLILFRRYLPAPAATAAPSDRLPLDRRRRLVRYLGLDYVGSLLFLGSTALLPVVVVSVLGSRSGAYFYIDFTVVSAVDLLALGLATAVVVEGSHHEDASDALAASATVRYLALFIPAAAGLIALAPLVLLPFGHQYVVHGVTTLRLLLCASPGQAIITLVIARHRLLGQPGRIVVVQGLTMALTLAAVGTLITGHGLVGVGVGWLVGHLAVAVVVLPGLVRSPARWGSRAG